jgi:protein SCO1
MRDLASFKYRRAAILCAVLLGAAIALAACSNSASPGPQAKRFHLKGKIISIDTAGNSVTIDHEAIPGFMEAMTMPYPVRSGRALAGLSPGDEITADVVVPDGGVAYLENIVVTKKSSGTAPAPTGALHHPEPGEKVPDFALINQDGKRVHISSFRGSALIVTFIYTRCPFPDYCPLVTENFAKIYAATRKDVSPKSNVRLLSVSFDPEHDTPPVLRKYAETFKGTAGGKIFDRWEFAAAPRDQLKEITGFFGLYYSGSDNQIVHSMSTTVISPNGTVYKWYFNNDWKPADLVADAAASAQQKSGAAQSVHAQATAPAAATSRTN